MCAPSPLRTLGTSSIGDGGWPPAECDGREEAALELPTAPAVGGCYRRSQKQPHVLGGTDSS